MSMLVSACLTALTPTEPTGAPDRRDPSAQASVSNGFHIDGIDTRTG